MHLYSVTSQWSLKKRLIFDLILRDSVFKITKTVFKKKGKFNMHNRNGHVQNTQPPHTAKRR